MGYLTALLAGALGGGLVYATVSLSLALFGGLSTRLNLFFPLLLGAVLGLLAGWRPPKREALGPYLGLGAAGLLLGLVLPDALGAGRAWGGFSGLLTGLLAGYALRELKLHPPDRETWEVLGLRALRALGFVFFVFVVVFPFWGMLVASLKPRAEFLANPADLSIPLSVFKVGFWAGLAKLLAGYRAVLVDYHFLRYIANTAYVAVSTMLLTLFLSVLGAYAVARLDFPGRRWMERAVLLTYMFPAIVLAIPLYAIFTMLGLRNTLSGLIVVYLAQTLPVALYMLRSYFETIPASLEEAGLIDGCSRFEVIWRITLPLSLPALASVGLYVFMIAWNEFLFAFMFLDSPEIFTLSRGMVALNSQEVPYQYLMAGAVIVTVPVMLLFFWFERYLVGGLTAGGVKG